MTNLIQKLLESKDAKLDRAYELAIKAFNENSNFTPNDSKIHYKDPLITELGRGIDCSRERNIYKFRGRYLLGIQKERGTSLSGVPYGRVESTIKIPGRRHISRTDYSFGPEPTLKLVDPNLWTKCLENREKVLDQIVEKYSLETPWNDDSGFDFLLKQFIGGYNYLKGEYRIDLDEKEVVKRTSNFIEALGEWARNDPTV